jgi:hypothetical protein
MPQFVHSLNGGMMFSSKDLCESKNQRDKEPGIQRVLSV